MTLRPLGDSAWLVEFPGITGEAALARVMGLAAALENDRPAGVRDVVSSYASLAVHFDSDHLEEIREWIGSVTVVDRLTEGQEREIPVCYGGKYGPDLVELAKATGLSMEEVVAMHSGPSYTVAAVGFSPGFPYLLGLPDRLRVPRLHTPRLAVPAGSVAVAGEQAGIYPFTSPGGWHLLGRTDVRLFDPSLPHPALLKPGDKVRFVPVNECKSPPEIATSIHSVGERWLEVIEPGSQTTVQDLGRPGNESSGVSPGGAVDRQALRLANLLVGNDEGAAALEICMSGPVLKFHAPAMVALASSKGKIRRVDAGETVDFSKLTSGVRACLAVAGGLCVPEVMGSAATDLRTGFGGHCGRALQSGDRLEFGKPGRVPLSGDWYVGRAEMARVMEIELRFLPGVQERWFSEEARRRLRSRFYQLTPTSDRMGARLSGEKLELAEPREMISQPVACGSVQVPPDGQPIILLAERQTIGGYPQIGHIISADLPKLARAWPGTMLKFREVTLEHACELRRKMEQDFAWLRTGLDLLE
jgi:KipI family sensor histidine kinase inhibitor